MITFASAADLAATEGHTIGPTEWLEITQERINDFAKATGDFQWIHVDVERAAKEMPGGKTIAHGYLTLSLFSILLSHIYEVKSFRVINIGSNKLRFLSPVPVGSRVNLSMRVLSAEPSAQGARVTSEATFGLEGSERPALVAEVISLYFDQHLTV